MSSPDSVPSYSVDQNANSSSMADQSQSPDHSLTSSASASSPVNLLRDRDFWHDVYNHLSRGYAELMFNATYHLQLMGMIDRLKPLMESTTDPAQVCLLWEVCWSFPKNLDAYRRNTQEICSLGEAVAEARRWDELINEETRRLNSLTERAASTKVTRSLVLMEYEHSLDYSFFLRDLTHPVGGMEGELREIQEKVDARYRQYANLTQEMDKLDEECLSSSTKLSALQTGRDQLREKLTRHSLLVLMNDKLDWILNRTISDIGMRFGFEF